MNRERLMKILIEPVVSEKSALAGERNRQYVFKVLRDANKREIRLAVEQLFDVDVQDVCVINVKGKVKRFGKMLGSRPNWRKAYVSLAPGHEIEFGSGS